MNLLYCDLEFTLQPLRRFAWPILSRGPVLRGALGWVLREVVCDPLCEDPSHCRFGSECAYRKLFAPRAPDQADRLSLNRDRPRPFVVIPGDEPEEEFSPAESLGFTVRLFGSAVRLHPYVVVVFQETCRQGLGPARTPMRMLSVLSGGAPVAFSEASPVRVQRLPLDLDASPDGIDGTLTVRFRTPTYLKHQGREIRTGRWALAALACRVRDRVSSLYHFHSEDEQHPPPLSWDFKGLAEEGLSASCTADRTRWIDRRRRSSRTGQLHDLSGLMGEADYDGVTPRVGRLLEIGSVIHAGKHAAFGLGRFSLERKP